MPRYLVECTFTDHFALPGPDQGEHARLSFIENNALDCVTWISSFVALSGNKSFCVYEGPTPEAVRRAARRNGLPIDHITEVRILDPYRYP